MHHKEHHSIEDMLVHIRHYLPSQAPLKDFIHHNTLHGFQALPFHEAMKRANQVFGYKTYLSLEAVPYTHLTLPTNRKV